VTGGSGFPKIDKSVPSPARVWNYWVGGKDNFASDRAIAEQLLTVLPALPLIARLTRQFLGQAVDLLASEYRIRQFLDIGSGLPVADNTHEVAQRVAPSSRVVYVDNDPVVVSHANALLRSGPQGGCDYVLADLRHMDAVLAGAARTLDFTRPVAVLLLQVLHFVPDADDPYGLVARLMSAVPSGSFLVFAHGPSDVDQDAGEQVTRLYESTASPVRPRSADEVARFFEGLELLGPGLTAGTEWLAPGPGGGTPPTLPDGFSFGYNAIARKP